MATLLFGVETEFALSFFGAGGQLLDQGAMLGQLFRLARSRYAHLPDLHGDGMFLANGARFYQDAGAHPEYSSPECATPWDAVRYVQAGERILYGLAREVAEREPEVRDFALLRCNVDYAATGATWGTHESVLYRSNQVVLAGQILPFLSSRILVTGSGGWDSRYPAGLSFQLSPRVLHLVRDVSPSSTHDRGIFHTKNEPLGSGYNRLHLLCGESLCSELAVWLKVGTTALVVALIDGGLLPGEAVRLADPVDAMRRFSADPSCRATAASLEGPPRTALEIQRHYLRFAEENRRAPFMPPWTDEVCCAWRDVLDRLERSPDSSCNQIDWAIKKQIYEERARRRGFSWAALGHWSSVVRSLVEYLLPRGKLALPLTAEFLLDDGSPAAPRVQSLAPFLREHGLDWGELSAFLRLSAELRETDMRFGELGERGIFTALDRAGVLSHRVPGVEDIEGAVERPPAVGRARLRGAHVRKLSRARDRYLCDWASVQAPGRWLDLSDPFAESAVWKGGAPADQVFLIDPAAARRRTLVCLYDRALALNRVSSLVRSLGLLEQAAHLAIELGDAAILRWVHLWRATNLHCMGRLREAATALEETEQVPGTQDDYDVMYKVLTRRVLVMLDVPEPLAAIENAQQEAEAFVQRGGHPERTSRLHLVRARLDAARGRHAEAAEHAATALDGLPADPYGFYLSAYVRTLFTAGLSSNQIPRARACLEALVDPGRPEHCSEAVRTCSHSNLARRLGHHDEALSWAKLAVRQVRQSLDQAERVSAGIALVRARMAVGDLTGARNRLRSLLPCARGEVAGDRYAIRLLAGDYHLNRARLGAGLAPIDPESGIESPLRPPKRARADAVCHLTLAAMAYRRALREGRSIDRLLECDHRQTEVTGRRALLGAARATAGGRRTEEADAGSGIARRRRTGS